MTYVKKGGLNVKRKLEIFVLTLCLMLGFSSMTFASQLDFTLVNKTDFDMMYLWVASSEGNNKDWGEELLQGLPIESGQSDFIYFRDTEGTYRSSKWSIAVRDQNGTDYIWRNIDLRKYSIITIYYNPNDGKYWWHGSN